MKEIIQRIFDETPKFFKKIRAIGASLLVLNTGLLAVPNLPEKLVAIAGHAAIIGGVMIAIAQMTSTTPPQQNKKEDEN